ncbi:MAG: hypothetical protein CSA96_01765 [Bacteroidetes bacterium]|nr:MAG: hypothetical protein CSA96_01765 [Bacteroidota bacterium]
MRDVLLPLRKRHFLVLALCFLVPVRPLRAQMVPTHISHEGIYRFLDELATAGHIGLNSLMKPYSRAYIAEKLDEAETHSEALTSRQRSELAFYQADYNKGRDASAPATSWLWQKNHGPKRPDLFYYSDSLFQITVNPIVGIDVWSNENGRFTHWWNGVEAHATVGRFGIWSSLRDNHESEELTARDFRNQNIGGANIKRFSDGSRDFEEFRGGISYSWDWGYAGLIMDQFAWGENNAGASIFSGRTPAFPRFELSMEPTRWFCFKWIHASLVSEVVDSASSFYISPFGDPEYRRVYFDKFMSANMFSFTPWPGLQLSAGNSVIYDSHSARPGFLIPVAFYKAIDHTQNAGIDNMNSQLFLSFSSRNLKNIHLYGTVFIDEFAASRVFNDSLFNFVSYKGGLSTTLIPNTRFVVEYTWSNALTYMHYVPTTTFESNRYNLGHYLEDNARELYLEAAWRPWRALNLKAWYRHASKGPDHSALGTSRLGIVPFEPIVWESMHAGVLASLQLSNEFYLRLGYEWRRVSGEEAYIEQWTAGPYHGETGTWRMGINIGF